MYNLSSQVKSSQVKSSQVNLLRFFLGALIALSLLTCGTAFADLAYIEKGELILVDAQGTTQNTGIYVSQVFPFTHNGSPRILVTSGSGNIAVYDFDNLSAPLANGTLGTNSKSYNDEITSVAELGSNIVIAYDYQLFEVNPATCEVVNTYNPGSSGSNYQIGDERVADVYPYGGQIVVLIERVSESSGMIFWDFNRIVTMDSLGHITGTFDAFSVDGALEASGGELYFALGDSAYYSYSEAMSLMGIYRVSGMLGNMNVNNAVRVTTDNPCQMTRDGKGGLYYTVWDSEASNSSHPRYIYHWDGSSSSQVYDAGSGKGVEDIHYDIKNGVLYAKVFDSSYGMGYGNDLTALVPDASGKLTASQTFGSHNNFAVVGNPADSSSGSTVTPNTQNTTQTQNASLPSSVIEPVTLSDDLLDKIASVVSTDKSQIHYLTQDNISAPQEPTQAMKDYAQSDSAELIGKLNTITVDSEGWYVFKITLTDELYSLLQGKNVSDFKFYGLNDSDATQPNASFIMGLLNTWEVLTLSGEKMETFGAKEFLMVGFLNAGKPFSVYLAKIIIALLSGGCEVGSGIAGLCVLGLVLLRLRK